MLLHEQYVQRAGISETDGGGGTSLRARNSTLGQKAVFTASVHIKIILTAAATTTTTKDTVACFKEMVGPCVGDLSAKLQATA